MQKLNYFIVSNQLLSETEPIEETIRERNQSLYKIDEFKTDFWVINTKSLIKKDYNVSNLFKKSTVFKKLKSIYFSKSLDCFFEKNFTIIFTKNNIFIDWVNLKIPNLEIAKNLFENIETTINQLNIETSIGISGIGKFNKMLLKKDETWLNSKYIL